LSEAAAVRLGRETEFQATLHDKALKKQNQRRYVGEEGLDRAKKAGFPIEDV
jgi:hypothetical protein